MLAFKSFVIQHKRKHHLAEILALLKYMYTNYGRMQQHITKIVRIMQLM